MMEYENSIICKMDGSVLFCFTVAVMASLGFAWMCKLIWVLGIRLRPPSSTKSKRRTRRKRKNAGIKPNHAEIKPNHAEIKPNNDVSMNDNIQVNDNPDSIQVNDNLQLNVIPPVKDTKESILKSFREFTCQELNLIFTEGQLLYRDGMGDVYKVKLADDDTNQELAIRRLMPYFVQTREDFASEALFLSQANHPNIAKLIGYCVEDIRTSRLVIYKYESGGSLENYLHGSTTSTCLEWKTRLKIAGGVAKAVEYMHNVMDPPIMHLYIAPPNIWLDEEMTPKLSFCGVIRMYTSPERIKWSIASCGSYKYGWQDGYKKEQLSIKVDIYGFGILLLEMITGRKGIFFSLEEGGDLNLTDWVRPYLEGMGVLRDIVDPKLEGRFDSEELYELCDIAKACIEIQPNRRPLISDVVRGIGRLVG